jgi:hypothetical protein
MVADPGSMNPGGTPPAEPNQNEGSGSPREASGIQGQRRRQGARHGQQHDEAPTAPKFEERCDDLKGHVYDYANPRQTGADQYTKSTREVCE